MKYKIYRKGWTESQGRGRLCGEQTGWCDCATVINQSRHTGAGNLGARMMSGIVLDADLGSKRTRTEIQQVISHQTAEAVWQVCMIQHLPLLRKK